MILDCQACAATVNAEHVTDYIVPCEPESPDPATRYTVLKCPRCGRPFIVLEEDIGVGAEGWDGPHQIYPTRETTARAIPRQIAETFEEAMTCSRARAHTATAILCRKTLEGVCSDHGASKGSLKDSLARLRDSEIIDTRLFEWADALRLSGNEAAHDVNVTIPALEASDIVAFTKALLEYVYTYRARFEEFQARRKSRNKSNED